MITRTWTDGERAILDDMRRGLIEEQYTLVMPKVTPKSDLMREIEGLIALHGYDKNYWIEKSKEK